MNLLQYKLSNSYFRNLLHIQAFEANVPHNNLIGLKEVIEFNVILDKMLLFKLISYILLIWIF